MNGFHLAILATFWLVLAGLAIANGTLRDKVYAGKVGEKAAHVISTMLLAAIIVAVSTLMLAVTGFPRTPQVLWAAGALWLGATVAFEFLFGHFVAGHSWKRLFADYNILRGRLWIIVLIATAAGPRLGASILDEIAP